MRNPTTYYMEGRHSTKVHVKVPTGMGTKALCLTHTSYSMDVVSADVFAEFPRHRKCKRCMRKLSKEAALSTLTTADAGPVACEDCNGTGWIETGQMENGPGGWGYEAHPCHCEVGNPIWHKQKNWQFAKELLSEEFSRAGYATWAVDTLGEIHAWHVTIALKAVLAALYTRPPAPADTLVNDAAPTPPAGDEGLVKRLRAWAETEELRGNIDARNTFNAAAHYLEINEALTRTEGEKA